jgi:hypothetical protein
MNKVKYHLISLAFLIAAIVAYTTAPTTASILLFIGMLLECTFWARVFTRPKTN